MIIQNINFKRIVRKFGCKLRFIFHNCYSVDQNFQILPVSYQCGDLVEKNIFLRFLNSKGGGGTDFQYRDANSIFKCWLRDMVFVLICLVCTCLYYYDPVLGYPATCMKIFGKIFNSCFFFSYGNFFSKLFEMDFAVVKW